MGADWTPGAQVGEYRLLAPLGGGGQGVVWKVRHEPTGALRALKTHRAALDPSDLARFQREGEALARLSHENVVRVHAMGVHAGRPWLAMDLIAGGDLQRRLTDRGPLAPREAARVVRDVARGLASAHAQGVLHRDLKPSNVLFDEQERPCLADFGLARVLDAASLTVTGELVGTPTYFSPEQLRGEATPASDVHGLGSLLHAALTGAAPFAGASLPEMLHRLSTTEPEPPSKKRAGIPPALDELCLRALARDPARRFGSAAALADALDGWLISSGAPTGSRRPLLLLLLLLVPAAPLALLARGPEPAPPPPVAGTEPSPVTPAPPASRTDASESRWLARVRRDPPPARLDEIEIASISMVMAETRRQGLSPAGLATAYRSLADRNHPWPQWELAQLLLARPDLWDRTRAIAPTCEEEAAEWLWRSSRLPIDPRSLARLADLLTDGHGAVPVDPAAAREMLALAERADLQAWTVDRRIRVACGWLGLGGPGDLARGLTHLRQLGRTSSGELGDRLLGQGSEPWTDPPAGSVVAAIARLLGWARPVAEEAGMLSPPEEVLQRALGGGNPSERRAALLWLSAAATAGQADARRLLAAGGHAPPEPEAIDPRDLLALDGLPVVERAVDGLDLIRTGEEHLAIMDRIRAENTDPRALTDLRALALRRHAPAEWDLARLLWEREPRRALTWAVRSAISSQQADVSPGVVDGRVLVARILILFPEHEGDPALAGAWLAGHEAEVALAPGGDRHRELVRREARLWLGLCRMTGTGVAADPDTGFREARGALGSEGAFRRLLARAARDPRFEAAATRILGGAE